MTSTRKPIKGKIAGVVTRKNVLINRGAQDGVKEGMRFSVNLKIGTIVDPDDPTNVMEELSFKKAKLKVSAVYDRMSYCAIEGTLVNPLLNPPNPFTGLFENRYPAIGDEEMVSESDWKMRRGDPVEEIVVEGDEKSDD